MDAAIYQQDILLQFQKLKELAEKAFQQVQDDGFFRQIDENPNSIAHIVKHMAGNMRSRWTDFLITDGEKPDRHRDTEFIISDADTRASLMSRWEAGWQLVFDAVASLAPEDFERTVTIRSEPYRVVEAIHRQVAHYAYHVGQLVMLARHFAGSKWTTLSVPLNQSEALNTRMRESGGKSDPQKTDLV